MRIPLSAGASGAVIETGSRIRIADAYSDARFDRQADTLTGYKTRDILAVPVFRRGATPPQVMGVLEALNSRTGFVDSDEALLASMALQVADRLLPELLQDMVETQAHDHELDDDEVRAPGSAKLRRTRGARARRMGHSPPLGPRGQEPPLRCFSRAIATTPGVAFARWRGMH